MRSREPEESPLIDEAVMAYETLVAPRKIFLDSFGFNLEAYYQTKDVIRINDYFNEISGTLLDLGAGLMDFGWQWTIAETNGKAMRGYFLKVTAPLEFAMHHNAHFAAKEPPPKKDLLAMFKETYESMHATASKLKL
jgi:hypothetical protein